MTGHFSARLQRQERIMTDNDGYTRPIWVWAIVAATLTLLIADFMVFKDWLTV